MRLIGRIGLFFLFVGVIFMVLFIGTEQTNQPQFLLCFAGLIALGLGAGLIARDVKPAQPVDRFRLIRRIRQKKCQDSKKGMT